MQTIQHSTDIVQVVDQLSSIIDALGITKVRIIKPDAIVTSDFRLDRLSIHVDENDNLISLDIG